MKQILDIQSKQKYLKHQLVIEKKKEHKIFFKQNKKLFYLLDFLVIICIVMNFGALVLTNILVSQKDYAVAEETGVPVVYMEINQIQGKVNNFETVEDVTVTKEQLKKQKEEILIMWQMLLRQSLFWAFILFMYILQRTRIYNYQQLGMLIFVVCFYFSIIGYDFWHDVGLYLGKIFYG